MELREFVADALLQIQQGVSDAITEYKKLPNAAGHISPFADMGGGEDWKPYYRDVEFDLTVTVSGETKGSAKAGGKIMMLMDAGGEVSKSAEHSTVQHIKFSIPILPPVSAYKVG
jgi:hypothetical protein